MKKIDKLMHAHKDVYKKEIFCSKQTKQKKLTTLSGRDVIAAFPSSETAKSSSGGGFSLKTSLPFDASSASSGSLRLFRDTNRSETPILWGEMQILIIFE